MSDNRDIHKKIDAYVKGTLAENEIEELWVEFAKQPDLLDQLELEVGVKTIIEQELAGSTKTGATIRKMPSWTWHAVAAAVLVLVAFIQIFQIPSKSSLEQFVLNDISADQLETSDGVRSKEMQITAADSILNLGFSEFVSGNDERALTLFNEVISEFDYEPYGSKAYLNKGIVYYNQSKYDSAIVAFEFALQRVEDSRMIEEKSHWYLGNALVNIGQFEEARTAIMEAYSLDGVFRKPAFLLLQKLNYDLGYTQAEEVGQ
ncbi:MAG: tetratricopeptide repeat protein [Balneolaceae bacterium]|nr:tetratricopeptide repeat protein [Balneolaceae bacterium]